MDDYYNFINGEWFNKTTLSEEQSRINAFENLAKNNNKKIEQIVTEEEDVLIKTVLNKCVNSTDHELKEIILKYLKQIDDVKTIDDYVKILTKFVLYGTQIFFTFFISRDIDDPNKYVFTITPSNLSIPSYKLFLKHENDFKQFIENYCEYFKIDCTNIFIIEKLLTKNFSQNINQKFISTKYDWIDFKKLFCINLDISLEEYAKYVDLHFTEISVKNIEFLHFINFLLSKLDLDSLKNYLKYKFILSLSHICKPIEAYKFEFDFFDKTLRNKTKFPDKHQLTISYIKTCLSGIINKYYMKKYVNSKIVKYVDRLVKMIKKSAKIILLECSWLTETVKTKAIEKLDFMKIKIGGKCDVSAYENFYKYLDEDLISMSLHFEREQSIRNLKLLNSTVDKEKWSFNSYCVNAYYSPLNNEIAIPYAMIDSPFYNVNNSFFQNLGGIGVIIAHEISHAFDNHGRFFDKNGVKTDWWTLHDIEEYDKRTLKIVKEYSKIKVLNSYVSGENTLSENIADYTGLIILMKILRKMNASINNYKEFFEQYAKIWKQKIRDVDLLNQIKNDVHSYPRLRVNIVLKNIPEFKRIYNLKIEDEMYVADDKQFNLWK